jgi:hypothetical protein
VQGRTGCCQSSLCASVDWFSDLDLMASICAVAVAQPSVVSLVCHLMYRHLHGIVSGTHSLPLIPGYKLIACTSVFFFKYIFLVHSIKCILHWYYPDIDKITELLCDMFIAKVYKAKIDLNSSTRECETLISRGRDIEDFFLNPAVSVLLLFRVTTKLQSKSNCCI